MRVLLTLVAFLYALNFVAAENPYRTIGMAPYNSIEEIKTKCKKLVKTFHPDKYKGDKNEARSKFDKVQKACKEIRDSRSDEDESTTGFNSALKKCIGSIIVSIIVTLLGYFFTMFLFKFFAYTMKFSIIAAITFFIVDNFFAHQFDSEEAQYGWTFLIAVFIVSLGWIKDIIFGKLAQRAA
jgi:preprotein translocase subunit Sec63